MMSEELQKLYNTLLTIETKGESTIIMADCLRFLDQLRHKCEETKVETINKDI